MQWFNVEVYLPKDNKKQDLLAWDGKKTHVVRFYYRTQEYQLHNNIPEIWFRSIHNQKTLINITHWCYLPKYIETNIDYIEN